MRAEQLTKPKKPVLPADNTTIDFGTADGAPVRLPVAALTRHLHCIGTTSAGKSNFLENLVRQLIAKGYGVCLLDPHGGHTDGLYTKTLHWLADSGIGSILTKQAHLHIVDPNVTSHVTGFNPLARPDNRTSLSVVAGATLGAFERVWDDENSLAKPTTRRVLKGAFQALAELGLTLAEAELLFEDPRDASGFRASALDQLQDPYARSVLERIDRLGRQSRSSSEYDAEIVGPTNRIAEFVSSEAIRLMVGQTEHGLDFPAILDEGHVLLVNLQEGAQVGIDETNLLGRMLLHALFFHSKRRTRPERPFVIIVDECHRILSGDVAHILSESRKFGISLVLGHQYLAQIREAGEQVHHAIRNNCGTKVVFRIEDTEEAAELAGNVVPLDLELPVHSLIKPSAIGQEIVRLTGEGYSKSRVDSTTRAVADAMASTTGHSSGQGTGLVSGEHTGEISTPGAGWLGMGEVLSESSGSSTVESSFQTSATMNAVTKSLAESTAKGIANGNSLFGSVTEALATVYRDIPGAVHSKDNVLYMAARRLRELKTGTAFITHGGVASVVDVPLASPSTKPKVALHSLRSQALNTSPASLSTAKARALLERRMSALTRTRIDEEERFDPWEE